MAIGFLSGKELSDTSYNRNSSYFDIIGKRKIKYYDIDTQGFSEATRELYLIDKKPEWYISHSFCTFSRQISTLLNKRIN